MWILGCFAASEDVRTCTYTQYPGDSVSWDKVIGLGQDCAGEHNGKPICQKHPIKTEDFN